MSELTKWSHNMQQSSFAQAENKILSQHVSLLRGFYLLLLGDHQPLSWLPKHCLHAFSLSKTSPTCTSHIQSTYDKLPILPSSIDAVIAPYLLEYIDSPDVLLDEVFHSLIPEGKLLILGFERIHPWCWINTPKPITALYSWKIKQLLLAMQFNINKIEWFYYGAAFLIEAQKQVGTVTPVKPKWAKPAIQKSWQPTVRKSL